MRGDNTTLCRLLSGSSNRLTEWGVHRIYGYPGDGINAFLGALARVENHDPFFVQTRHEEMAAFMACAHSKFTGEIGVAWRRADRVRST